MRPGKREKTHIISCHRHDGWEEEDDADEGCPATSPDVDELARLAKMPRPSLELVEEELADDRDAVGPVKRNGTEVEDGRDSDVAPQPDQVDQNADDCVQPHSKHRRVRLLPDLVPDAGAGQELVASESPDRARAGLQGCNAHEVHDQECCDGEKDGRTLAHHVVV